MMDRKRQQRKFEKAMVALRGQWKGRGKEGLEKRQARHKTAKVNRMHRHRKRKKKREHKKKKSRKEHVRLWKEEEKKKERKLLWRVLLGTEVSKKKSRRAWRSFANEGNEAKRSVGDIYWIREWKLKKLRKLKKWKERARKKRLDPAEQTSKCQTWLKGLRSQKKLLLVYGVRKEVRK